VVEQSGAMRRTPNASRLSQPPTWMSVLLRGRVRRGLPCAGRSEDSVKSMVLVAERVCFIWFRIVSVLRPLSTERADGYGRPSALAGSRRESPVRA